MRTLLTILFLLVSICYGISADYKGLPIITNLKPEIYQGGSRIYSIACTSNGLMFAGHKNGIMEFNGQNWSKIDCGFSVTSLTSNSNNEVFVAGTKGIGKLELDSTNNYQYKSLNELISNEKSLRKNRFAQVFNIEDEVIFVWGNEIIINSEKNIRIIEATQQFTYCQKLNNDLYFYSPQEGVFQLIDHKIVPLYTVDFIKNKDVRGFLHYNGQLSIIINQEGIFTLKHFTPQNTSTYNQQIKEMTILGVNQIDSSSYIIKTYYSGAYIIDNKGNLLHKFHFKEGLANNTVFCAEKDPWNNLWLGTASGISSIRLDFPFTKYNSPEGIGTAYASCLYNETFYFATSQGLYKMIQTESGLSDFELIHRGHVWGLHQINNTLYFGHVSGIYALQNDHISQISNIPGGWYIKQIPFAPNYFMSGSPLGLLIFKHDDTKGKLGDTKLITKINDNIKNIEFDTNQFVWAEGEKGIYRFKLNLQLPTIQELRTFDRVEANNKLRKLRKLNNQIIFIADSGVYKINQQDLFYRDSLFKTLYEHHEIPSNIIVDKYSRIWTFSNGNLSCYSIHQNKLKNISRNFQYANKSYPIDYESITCVQRDFVILGQEEGFLGHQLNAKTLGTYSANRINKIIVTDDNGEQQNLEQHVNYVNRSQQIQMKSKLQYGSAIKFYFSAGYSKHNMVKYTTFLMNFDEKWHDWNDEAIREFTNLPSGKYKFIVRSKNKANEESLPAFCEFEILPPWYLTTTSKIIEIILFLLLIFVSERIIRYRIKKVRQKIEKERKELIYRNQQKQKEEALIQQQDQIKQRNQKLRAENLSKSKELANTTMDIIKKNQFLTDLKEDLVKIQELSMLNKIVTSDIKSIIKKIDKDIDNEENWKVFEDYFDRVHEKFLKRLKEKHPSLTPKDLRLCAYLRMNLATKEIAPLLNISVRGVEISRYRLRKKLDLDRNKNLNEFLLKF